MTRYLIVVFEDIESRLEGPFDSDKERTQAAQSNRDEHGKRDGLFWLDIGTDGTPKIGDFGCFEGEDDDELPTFHDHGEDWRCLYCNDPVGTGECPRQSCKDAIRAAADRMGAQ